MKHALECIVGRVAVLTVAIHDLSNVDIDVSLIKMDLGLSEDSTTRYLVKAESTGEKLVVMKRASQLRGCLLQIHGHALRILQHALPNIVTAVAFYASRLQTLFQFIPARPAFTFSTRTYKMQMKIPPALAACLYPLKVCS